MLLSGVLCRSGSRSRMKAISRNDMKLKYSPSYKEEEGSLHLVGSCSALRVFD